jgi:hypothetical protein
MPATVVFDVLTALITQAKAHLPDIIVSDGLAITQDPGSYLMVGIDDPEAVGLAVAAASQQQWATLGDRQRDDNGVIHCVAESWNGDADPQAARDAVKATLDAVASLLNADPTLGGVPGLLWVGYGSSSTLTQAQTSNGAVARMVFQIGYRARIQTI